jgi:hypothetical protein
MIHFAIEEPWRERHSAHENDLAYGEPERRELFLRDEGDEFCKLGKGQLLNVLS